MTTEALWCEYEPGRFPRSEFREGLHFARGSAHYVTGEEGLPAAVPIPAGAPLDAARIGSRPRVPVLAALLPIDHDISRAHSADDLELPELGENVIVEGLDADLVDAGIDRILVVTRPQAER